MYICLSPSSVVAAVSAANFIMIAGGTPASTVHLDRSSFDIDFRRQRLMDRATVGDFH